MLHWLKTKDHNLRLAVSLPFRDRHKPQECTRHWPFDQVFHLLVHLDPSSMDMCSLQLLCPRFIFTHSNRFGLLTAPRSTLLRESELAVLVRNLFPTFMPSNRVPVIIPSVLTRAIIKPRIVRVRIVSGIRLCRFFCFLTCL